MKLDYKTGSLPPNLITVGILLLGISIWRMIVLDWMGIVFLIISLLCLFIKSGVIIDADNRRIKKYNGFFVIKRGEWESIDSIVNIQLTKTRMKQSMNVLSINRTESTDVYKLLITLSDSTIEIMSGDHKPITKKAEAIAEFLGVPLKDRTK